MNLVKFLDTSASSIAKAAPRPMSARQEREAAAQAEQRHAMAVKVRQQWLDAITHDALLIGFGKTECISELKGANSAVIFALYGLQKQRVPKQILDGLISTVREIQAAMRAYKGCPPPALASVIAAGLSNAHDVVAQFTPIQVLNASFTFGERHPELIDDCMSQVSKERRERATLSLKKPSASEHLVTFGQKLH